MNKHLFCRTMAIFPPITGTLLIPYLEVQMEGSQVCCQGNHRWTHPGSWTAHSCPVTYKKLLCICNISSVLFVDIVYFQYDYTTLIINVSLSSKPYFIYNHGHVF